MMRTNPFEEMDRLFEQMRRSMFDAGMWDGETQTDPALGSTTLGSTNLRMEVSDDGDGYVVNADLPGFETEEIDLWFDDGQLSIEALHEHEGDDLVRNRRISEQISVPGDVLVDEITASYHNGVLEVRLPTESEPETSGHRIDID